MRKTKTFNIPVDSKTGEIMPVGAGSELSHGYKRCVTELYYRINPGLPRRRYLQAFRKIANLTEAGASTYLANLNQKFKGTQNT